MLKEHELKPAISMIRSVGGQASQEITGFFQVGYVLHITYQGEYQGRFGDLNQISAWCEAIERHNPPQQPPQQQQYMPPQQQHSQSTMGSWGGYGNGWF